MSGRRALRSPAVVAGCSGWRQLGVTMQESGLWAVGRHAGQAQFTPNSQAASWPGVVQLFMVTICVFADMA